MRVWRRFINRIVALGRKGSRRLDHELDEEILAHLEMAEQDAAKRGLSPEDARREARRVFGGVQQVREEHRRQRGAPAVETFARDVRYACRLLVSQPAWTSAAIACLAIATGANTAAFSVVNAVLLRPLPFHEARQLVMVALYSHDSGETRPFALREYREVAKGSVRVVDLAAYTFFPVGVGASGGAEMAEGQLVSGNYFDVLRVAPLAGRFFDVTADRPGAVPQVVISERLWRLRFSEDVFIVGRTVRVNGRPMIVSGVAPAGFVGAMGLIAPDIWLPATLYPVLTGRPDSETVPMFGAVGRRFPGVTDGQAQQAIDVLVRAMVRDSGEHAPLTAILEPASGFGVPPALRWPLSAAMTVVFVLAALVVIVAAANVASLVLARGTGRVREMGVRLALGASRSRVARQLLTESLVLASLGSAVGMLLSFWVMHLLQPGASDFEYVSYAVNIAPDLRVFGYAVAGAVLTAAVFGVLPAYVAVRTDVIAVLKPSAGAGRAPRTTRSLQLLVSSQIAVSTVLLIAAGLLGRSYVDARAVDPDFDTRNLLSVSVDLSYLGPTSEDYGRGFYDTLSERVAALPGVDGTSLTRDSPLSVAGREVPVWITADDRTGARTLGGPHNARPSIVTAQHFSFLGLPLLQGRVFAEIDTGGPHVAVLNETMARRLWPSASPLGRSFYLDGAGGERVDVIGVVKDLRGQGADRPTFYEPFTQRFSTRMILLVRSRLPAEQLAAAIRGQIAALNPDLPVLQIRTVDELKSRADAPRRRAASLVGTAGAIGLALATVGLYGVTSFGVRARIREFGIRIALGATAGDVRRQVLASGLRTVIVGLVAGVTLSLAATRLLAGLLVGIAPYDPVTMAAVVAALTTVATVALLLSARAATAVEPTVALRNE